MKILIVRFSSLGDVILVSSVLDGLSKYNIDADVLTDDKYSCLFKSDTRVGEVITTSRYSVKALKKLSGVINSRKYDFIFDLHAVLKTFILSAFLKSKVIRYDKKSIRRRATIIFKGLKHSWLSVPKLYSDVFEKIGVHIENPEPCIHIPKEIHGRVTEVADRRPYVVICPGARWKSKRYPEIKFVEVAEILVKKGFSPIFLGGVEDFSVCERISGKVEGSSNLCGKFGILESMAIMSGAEFVISNDSASTHMARAVKTKVLTIFGPTHPAFGFAPGRNEGNLITLDLKCSPCSLHGRTSCTNLKCFNIEPRVIVDRAMQMLEG